MEMRVFAIFDSAAKAYSVPQFMLGRGVALRGFEDMANDASCYVGKHPMDYSLMELGTYNDETASFVMLPAPERICGAAELVRIKSVVGALKGLSLVDPPIGGPNKLDPEVTHA